MDFSDYGAEQTLRWVLGQTAQTPPTQLFVKLHIGDPGANGLDNPSGTTTREEYVAGTINAPGGGTDGNADVVNTGDINWQGLVSTETLSHVSLWDDVAAGDCWYKGSLIAPVPVVAGGNFQFLDQNGLIRHE